MTLNGVMAIILRHFSEFGSFQGTLRKSGWRYTWTFCDRPSSVSNSIYDSLWPYLYNLRNYSAIMWENKLAISSTDEFLYKVYKATPGFDFADYGRPMK